MCTYSLLASNPQEVGGEAYGESTNPPGHRRILMAQTTQRPRIPLHRMRQADHVPVREPPLMPHLRREQEPKPAIVHREIAQNQPLFPI